MTLSPILPDITDDPANLEAVIATAKEHGATHLFHNVLFLKPSAQQAFFPFLEKHFPHLRKRYAARFARSAFLDRTYKDRIFRLVAELKRKHGFPDGSEFDMPAPLHETEAEQLPLLQVDQLPMISGRNAQQPRTSRIAKIPEGKTERKGIVGLRDGIGYSCRG